MKFCKKYDEYMLGQKQKKLPLVGFKKLKKILKRCRKQIDSRKDTIVLDQDHQNGDGIPPDSSTCPQHCPVCDGTFFPSLLQEMSAVVGFFNEKAQKLLEIHLASGFSKCLIWFKDKLQGNHVTLIQEGRELATYAIINAIAMRKILKKYDKIHYSKQGLAFKSQAQSMHVEILQSPWFCELMAFHINSRESKALNSSPAPALFEGCSLAFSDGKPSLSCELFDSVKLDIDLTCSICLETFFEPVSLTCGHILCYLCACKAASVTIVDGLPTANHSKKCPICRELSEQRCLDQEMTGRDMTELIITELNPARTNKRQVAPEILLSGVYEAAVHLEELHILLRRRCPHEYWEERLKAEKMERLQQVKEHWELQCRFFTGI